MSDHLSGELGHAHGEVLEGAELEHLATVVGGRVGPAHVLLQADVRDVVCTVSYFKQAIQETVRICDVFSFMQHVRKGIVGLMLAVELLVVTRLMGIVDALTAHEVPVSLVGCAVRVHIVGCGRGYPELVELSAHDRAWKLKCFKDVAKEDNLVATGLGGVQVGLGAGPSGGPRARAEGFQWNAMKTGRAAVRFLGKVIREDGRVAWHAPGQKGGVVAGKGGATIKELQKNKSTGAAGTGKSGPFPAHRIVRESSGLGPGRFF